MTAPAIHSITRVGKDIYVLRMMDGRKTTVEMSDAVMTSAIENLKKQEEEDEFVGDCPKCDGGKMIPNAYSGIKCNICEHWECF